MLVIDDESDIREATQSFFKKRGIETLTAAGGREGLDILASQSPGLVLLDMRMPGMDGIEVLREMRARNFQTKVIMVTGVEESDITQEAQTLGVIDTIHKPLILSDLERIVFRELGK